MTKLVNIYFVNWQRGRQKQAEPFTIILFTVIENAIK